MSDRAAKHEGGKGELIHNINPVQRKEMQNSVSFYDFFFHLPHVAAE
jgi:hypothetical protein